MSWISVRYCTYITLLIPAGFNSTMREITAKHLFNIAYIYINSHKSSDQISDYKQREWLLSLWPSLHIGASRAERCDTRLYLTFRCSWQSCPFPNRSLLHRHKNLLLTRLCKPFGTRALLFWALTVTSKASTKSNEQSLVHLSGQIHTQ